MLSDTVNLDEGCKGYMAMPLENFCKSFARPPLFQNPASAHEGTVNIHMMLLVTTTMFVSRNLPHVVYSRDHKHCILYLLCGLCATMRCWTSYSWYKWHLFFGDKPRTK